MKSKCKSCERKLTIKEHLLGTRVACPGCRIELMFADAADRNGFEAALHRMGQRVLEQQRRPVDCLNASCAQCGFSYDVKDDNTRYPPEDRSPLHVRVEYAMPTGGLTSPCAEACPDCQSRSVMISMTPRSMEEVFRTKCENLKPSQDEFGRGVLDVERNQMRPAESLRFAGTLDSLVRILGPHFQTESFFFESGFDCIFVGDTIKIRPCPFVGYKDSKKAFDVVKSSNGDFWFGVDPDYYPVSSPIQPAPAVVPETARAAPPMAAPMAPTQPTSSSLEYFDTLMNDGDGLCSDNDCPCSETVIPRGTGYLYVSPEIVEFRRQFPRREDATREMQRRVAEKHAALGIPLGQGGTTLIRTGPVLVCEQGARLRNLNMEIAAADAIHCWNTGLAPLRPTPVQPAPGIDWAAGVANFESFARSTAPESAPAPAVSQSALATPAPPASTTPAPVATLLPPPIPALPPVVATPITRELSPGQQEQLVRQYREEVQRLSDQIFENRKALGFVLELPAVLVEVNTFCLWAVCRGIHVDPKTHQSLCLAHNELLKTSGEKAFHMFAAIEAAVLGHAADGTMVKLMGEAIIDITKAKVGRESSKLEAYSQAEQRLMSGDPGALAVHLLGEVGFEETDPTTLTQFVNVELIQEIARRSAAALNPPQIQVGRPGRRSRVRRRSGTSGLATASLILAIVSPFCHVFAAVPAVICGLMALSEISKSRGKLKGASMAMAGIVLGIVFSILSSVFLYATLAPSMSSKPPPTEQRESP